MINDGKNSMCSTIILTTITLLSCFSILFISIYTVAENTANVSYEETLTLVSGNDDFKITVEISKGEQIQYNWTSDYDIVFKIDDGGWGSSPVYLIQDHAKGTYTAPQNKTYNIIFESQEYGVNTTVNYEILIKKNQDEEPDEEPDEERSNNDLINVVEPESPLLPLYIIVIIVVVAVNIITGVIILLIFRAKNKKKPDVPVRQPQPTVQTPPPAVSVALPPQQHPTTPPPTQPQDIEVKDLPELQFPP